MKLTPWIEHPQLSSTAPRGELVSCVSSMVIMGVWLYNLFFLNHSSQAFSLQLKHSLKISNLFLWSELIPSFPWLLTQPARATCKPLHWKRMRDRVWVGMRKTGSLGEKWASVEQKTWNATERLQKGVKWGREMIKVNEWDRRGS